MSFWKKKSLLEEGELQPPSQGGVATSSPTSEVRTDVARPSSVGAPTPNPAVKATASLGSSIDSVPSASGIVAKSGIESHGSPEEILLARFGKTRSALGEGTVIQGKLSFDTPVRIDGKLNGEVFSSKVLIIGPSGRIDANIEAASLVVLGQVKGSVVASERVEIWSGAEVHGSLKTPVLVIHEGSSFSGSTQMLAAQAGLVAPVSKAKPSALSDQKVSDQKGNDSKAAASEPASKSGTPRAGELGEAEKGPNTKTSAQPTV